MRAASTLAADPPAGEPAAPADSREPAPTKKPNRAKRARTRRGLTNRATDIIVHSLFMIGSCTLPLRKPSAARLTEGSRMRWRFPPRASPSTCHCLSTPSEPVGDTDAGEDRVDLYRRDLDAVILQVRFDLHVLDVCIDEPV